MPVLAFGKKNAQHIKKRAFYPLSRAAGNVYSRPAVDRRETRYRWFPRRKYIDRTYLPFDTKSEFDPLSYIIRKLVYLDALLFHTVAVTYGDRAVL